MTTLVMKAPSGVIGQVTTQYGNYTIDSSTGLVTVDARAADDLMEAGFSVGNVSLGGRVTTSAAQASANAVVIATGLTTILGAIIQVVDAGNNVVTSDADVTFSGGNLTVADGATYNTVSGQIINWIAWGY